MLAHSPARPDTVLPRYLGSQGGIENTVQNLYLGTLSNKVRVKVPDSIRQQLLIPLKSRTIIRGKQQQQQQQSGPQRHRYTTKIREGTRGTKISKADCMPRPFPKSRANQQVRHRQSSLVSLVTPPNPTLRKAPPSHLDSICHLLEKGNANREARLTYLPSTISVLPAGLTTPY